MSTAPTLERTSRIWNPPRHCAFTDLTRYKGSWYCAFREASEHLRGTGEIRVLRSSDGESWYPSALIAQRGTDLRDPKLSIAHDGRLMLLAGGTRFDGDRYVGRQPCAVFSKDGETWSRPEAVLEDGDWLWRATWYRNTLYGVSYRLESPRVWTATLFSSRDAIHYRKVCTLQVTGKPNEATVRFRADGRAIALVRREGGDKRGWIGTAMPPYTSWRWHALALRLGGPNFLVLPDGSMWASTRVIRGSRARTCVGRLSERAFDPVIELPSGGDCSYPGMVWYRGRLWISYYSSHEGRTSIYLAVVRPR